jgi:hypothetical protein
LYILDRSTQSKGRRLCIRRVEHNARLGALSIFSSDSRATNITAGIQSIKPPRKTERPSFQRVSRCPLRFEGLGACIYLHTAQKIAGSSVEDSGGTFAFGVAYNCSWMFKWTKRSIDQQRSSVHITDQSDDAGFVLPSRLPILSAHSYSIIHPGGSISFFPGRRPDGSPRIYVSRSHRGISNLNRFFGEDSCITHLCPCHTNRA